MVLNRDLAIITPRGNRKFSKRGVIIVRRTLSFIADSSRFRVKSSTQNSASQQPAVIIKTYVSYFLKAMEKRVWTPTLLNIIHGLSKNDR
jgi:hypothetical protein